MATQLKERAKLDGHAEQNINLGSVPNGARKRRLPEMAAGLLLVAVCALAALWWQTSSTDRQPVLALRASVERGQVIELADLQVVSIDTDQPIAVLADTDAVQVVGRVARTDLPAGTLVIPSQFSSGSTLGIDEGVVGMSLDAGQFPSLALSPGDAVAIVLTPSPGDPRAFGDTIEATVLVDRAEVVEVAQLGVQGALFVAVQVEEDEAARVAAAAATNRVRLIQVSEVEQ